MLPGLMRLAGMLVAAPQVSVWPQTSSIGTPRARYHLISCGDIGAAPAIRKRARWMPMSLRTVFTTTQRPRPPPKQKCQLGAAAPALACQHQVGDAHAHADGPAIGRLLQSGRFLQRDHHAGVGLLPHP